VRFISPKEGPLKKKREKKLLNLNTLKADKCSPESLTPLEYLNAPQKALAVDVITVV
jgi:hypothetical protein